MTVWVQGTVLMLVTAVLVFGCDRIVGRRLPGGVGSHLVVMGLRMVLAVLVALVVALRAEQHRAVLVFAVGAAYFASVLAHGWFHFTRQAKYGRAGLGS